MKNVLTCHDMGDQKCTFEARSRNKEEIKEAFVDHIKIFHPDKQGDLDKNREGMLKQMDAKIHETFL
jgi:predicted small metal-binding protein